MPITIIDAQIATAMGWGGALAMRGSFESLFLLVALLILSGPFLFLILFAIAVALYKTSHTNIYKIGTLVPEKTLQPMGEGSYVSLDLNARVSPLKG